MFNYKLTVEVPLLLWYFSFLLLGNLSINLYMYKVCYNILGYAEPNCSRLGQYTDNSTQELETIVQPYAGTITAVLDMVPITIPIILSLMIGSWSDKYGRKPVMLLTLTCQTVGWGMSTIMLLFKELNPWWLLMYSIPITLCGGITTFFTVILSYLNDTSTPETRAMRMLIFDVIPLIASLAAGLSSSYLLYATNYPSVYGICTLLVGISLAYTYFFCPESLKHKSDEKPHYGNIFSCKNLADLFTVAGRKREHNKRAIIFLIILATTLLYFVTMDSYVKTLYLRNKFNWTLTRRNVFGALVGLVDMTCTSAGTYFLHKKLKIREMVLIIISLLSLAGSNLLYAIGTDDIHIYASAVVGIFSGIWSPLSRTMLAKFLVPEEMGKMFSLLMVFKSIFMLLSSLSYQQIYNDTIDTHPEAFNYVSIGLLGVIMVIAIIVMKLESNIPLEEQKIEENFNTSNTQSTNELFKEKY